MKTLDDEILADDAPLDVYAENALLEQHQWLVANDQGHLTHSSRGSAQRYWTGSTTAWLEGMACAVERIIYVIPVRLEAHTQSVDVTLCGLTSSLAASPTDIRFRAYLSRFSDDVFADYGDLAYEASNPSALKLSVDHPRPGEQLDDLLIVTMRSGLSDDDWHTLSDVIIGADGLIRDQDGKANLPADLEIGVESAAVLSASGWADVEGSNFNARSGPFAFGASPDDSGQTLTFNYITVYKPLAIELRLVGVAAAPLIPQAQLRPNIAVAGGVHARHELAIRRARDHRRLLVIDPHGDELVGAETTQLVRFKRAEYLNGYRELLRESIWLDRGAYGRVTAQLVVISCTGVEVSDDEVDRDNPLFTGAQDWRVRLLQYEDGSATPVEVASETQALQMRGFAARRYSTRCVLLAGARKWPGLRLNGCWHKRLEEYDGTNRGTSLRWGFLSDADMQAAQVLSWTIDLDTLDFDPALPLQMVIDIPDDATIPAYDKKDGSNPVPSASNWNFPRFGAHICVGGSIYWEGVDG